MPNATTVDPREVEHFSALAREWWDADGKFAALHRLNPVRLGFIREHVLARFARDGRDRAPLCGLTMLDIGCGGGLLTEPLARLGATVTGIDPAADNIATARVHAAEGGLDIDYRATTAEALAADGAHFDVVLNMEVVEHVTDVGLFMTACTHLVAPGGLMFVATINRTLKAFALAIVGAEFVLGWVPRGTHRWEKFVTPDELEGALARDGLGVLARTGVIYNPLGQGWQRGRDMDVNYMLVAAKARDIGGACTKDEDARV